MPSRSLDAGSTPGESLLRLVLNHFDRIATQREFQSLMQQEMVRFHRGESDAIPMLARSFYGPLLTKMEAVVREGIRTWRTVRCGLDADSLRRAGRECLLLSERADHAAGGSL